MLNSMLASASAFTANPHQHFPPQLTHPPPSQHHPPYPPSGHFWMDSANALNQPPPLPPTTTSSSVIANTSTSNTSSTSSLSMIPSSSFISDHNANYHHQHLYPASALQQHCSSLLSQIHLRNSTVGNSYHESVARHHYSGSTKQQQPQLPMIEHYSTLSNSTTAFPSLVAATPSHSYHSHHHHHDNPFHRLAEAIVATAKPAASAHHHRRSSSVIRGSNKSSTHKSSSSELSTAKVDGQSLNVPHHPHQQLIGNNILVGPHLPSSHASTSSSSSAHHCSIFDRRAKRPLTANELERKRDLANRQERRRMHRLNDALNRLREVRLMARAVVVH